MRFPRTALIVPAMALGLIGLVVWAVVPHNYVPGNFYRVGNKGGFIIPSNVRFQIGPKPLTVLQKKSLQKLSLTDEIGKLSDLLVPPADATQFLGATNTVTPGANINLQLATPQASAAYVKCDFSISPFCRIYANAAISTLALFNGTDGGQYVVEIVQDNTGRSVAVPTAGGTPANITTQVAGWDVGTAPINAAVAAPTQQAGAIITWNMIYDSSAGAFIVYSVN
jgi:hypothetical protein